MSTNGGSHSPASRGGMAGLRRRYALRALGRVRWVVRPSSGAAEHREPRRQTVARGTGAESGAVSSSTHRIRRRGRRSSSGADGRRGDGRGGRPSSWGRRVVGAPLCVGATVVGATVVVGDGRVGGRPSSVATVVGADRRRGDVSWWASRGRWGRRSWWGHRRRGDRGGWSHRRGRRHGRWSHRRRGDGRGATVVGATVVGATVVGATVVGATRCRSGPSSGRHHPPSSSPGRTAAGVHGEGLLDVPEGLQLGRHSVHRGCRRCRCCRCRRGCPRARRRR